MIENEMYQWAQDLFPINRSLTGEGVRTSLSYIKNLIPELKIKEVKSGTKVYDWEVPNEWNIKEAYIEDENGSRIVDFQEHNLHIVSYSIPINEWIDLEELDKHLYSLPEQPDAIPYVTSYYSSNWGFCLSHRQRERLRKGRYRVFIDSNLKPGVMNFGELLIQGQSKQEILLSTYICHPSMGNNELSGPIVTTALSKWLLGLQDSKFSYRIIFVPETIGAIVYLQENFAVMKENIKAGFNLSCIGDDRCYSYLPSRHGNTVSDLAARHVLKNIDKNYKVYTWLDRGSNERQLCAPGVDLPIATIMRSKYGEYPEYHTSLDDLKLISPKGLKGGYEAVKKAIEVIEVNCFPKILVLGEPQLGKRGLYPNIHTKESTKQTKAMRNLMTYCDGKKSLLEIADLIDEPFWELMPILDKFEECNLIEKLEERV